MGYMKELDIRIRQGGDDAIAAVSEYVAALEGKVAAAAEKWICADMELRSKGRWIPVEERLPPDNVAVLVNHESTGVEMAFRQGGQWGISWTNHMHSGCAYTHWMPLADPPKCATH
jgi:hypothetical protein